MPNKDTREANGPFLSVRTEREIEHKIKELRKKLESLETPKQREQYIRGLIHGHLWVLETVQSDLKLGLNDIDFDTFLASEIQFQKIFCRSVVEGI